MTLKLAFYGDDFTGSTDALEVLAFAGLRTALFLRPPTPQALLDAGPLDAFGVKSLGFTGRIDEVVGQPIVHRPHAGGRHVAEIRDLDRRRLHSIGRLRAADRRAIDLAGAAAGQQVHASGDGAE